MQSSSNSPHPGSRFAASAVWILVSGILLHPFAAWPAAALTVVPAAYTSVEGNSDNSVPFGSGDFCTDGIRYQQLYKGSEVGGPNIGSMAFRLNGSNAEVGTVNYGGVTVTLSSTLATYATMSTTFADNIGPDATVVYSGDLSVDPSAGGSPNAFDFTINFDTPFAFDGTHANLLVDITIEDCYQGTTFFLDASDGDNAVVRNYASDKDDTEGEIDTIGENRRFFGLVTQFYIYSEGVIFIPKSKGAGGNWTVVGHNGEGFLFEPLADGTVVIFWFTYDLFGNQMWLIGVAAPGDFQTDGETGDDVAEVDMYRTSGPSFGPEFNPDDYAESYIGTATFHLHGCVQAEGATGEVDYNFDFGFGSGTYNIQKLYDIYKNDCSP